MTPTSGSSVVPVAETDLFLIGLRRSGIHAIVSWLIPHLSGVTRLINDHDFHFDGQLAPIEGLPTAYFQSRAGKAEEFLPGPDVERMANDYIAETTMRFLEQTPAILRPFVASVMRKYRRFRRTGFERYVPIPYDAANRSFLANTNLFVIENMSIDEFVGQHARWREEVYRPYLATLGMVPAPRVRIVQPMREPWNQLASLIKNPPSRPPRVIPPEGFLAAWLDYAREFAGRTRRLAEQGEVLSVSYPKWFSDASYRVELAARLGVEPTDSGLNVVANFGGGSSFDGQRMTGRAQAMKVSERWRAYADHPLMRDLCGNAEVRELSREIFGCDAPGNPA
jgi:hypothetical protein